MPENVAKRPSMKDLVVELTGGVSSLWPRRVNCLLFC